MNPLSAPRLLCAAFRTPRLVFGHRRGEPRLYSNVS